jgi:hypothetical protein
MVTVEGYDVPMASIDDAMDEIDVDELEDMKQLSEKNKEAE